MDEPKDFKVKVVTARAVMMTALLYADSLREASAEERANYTRS